ncbi:VOC family protein [Nocardioides sp.]|uniref:VOC family protein n=1 Tax=Nocardioides sp. TaxID=35761 RepID=UPI0025F02A20|nr:VOC family protein [Nocardioides sp.]
MTAPTPYLLLPGTARAALDFYAGVFGGEAVTHTLAEFGRSDGPPDAVAHGWLRGGPVDLFASDAAEDQRPFRSDGLLMSLLGTAGPETLRGWFAALAEGGRVVEPLETRPWGDTDGQVVDRFGVPWLIGFQGA